MAQNEEDIRAELVEHAEMLNATARPDPPIDTNLPMEQLEEEISRVMRQTLPRDTFDPKPGDIADSIDIAIDHAIKENESAPPENPIDPSALDGLKN